jgi:hypothetical protein
MKKEKNNQNSQTDIEVSTYINLLKTLSALNKRGTAMVFFAFVLISVLKFVFRIHIADAVLIIIFFFFLIISIYTYILNYLLNKKEVPLHKIESLCFSYFMINIFLYSAIIHYIGGIEWIGVFIYFFMIVEANILLSKKKGFFITTLATLCYLALGFLEYRGIIQHHYFFISGSDIYKNFNYLLVTVGVVAFFGFHYVGFLVGLFGSMYKKTSNDLNEERKKLIRTYSELEEARDTLEVKVRARTRELEELTKNLEKQVAQRTNELQEKLKELERFQKFAIGREIKMVDLKEKIKKLQKKKE